MSNAKSLILLTSLFLTGCAYENRQLHHYKPHSGYRLSQLAPTPINTQETFLILSFSGGGTRAAAFAFGAMQELRATNISASNIQRPLLDEVDLISSVSGGSFTSAYYGLYGDRLFTDFDRDFLKKDVQGNLARRAINPLNWPKLLSPYYDRIDLAADYYDKILFHHHVYQDLLDRGARPLIVINATDMALGSRFEFTQEQFDLLGSDLASFPISRAVAASSAFPVLLSPVTLRNYPSAPEYTEPAWIKNGLEDGDINGKRFRLAKIAHSYRDTDQRRYIHLLDGGISDNIGLRGPSRSLNSTDGSDSILAMINKRELKRVAVISVNAKPGSHSSINRKKNAPGVLGVLSSVISGPMSNYSFETVESLNDEIEQRNQNNRDAQAIIDDMLSQYPNAKLPNPLPAVEFYNVELSFDRVKDPTVRQKLKDLPTSFSLKTEEVDMLKQAARDLLRGSETYQSFVASLQG